MYKSPNKKEGGVEKFEERKRRKKRLISTFLPNGYFSFIHMQNYC